MNKLIFLCISSAVVIFTVIVLNVSPVINIFGTDWYDNSCKYFADKHKYEKEKNYASQEVKDEVLDFYKKGKSVCNSRKAMVGLEYASLNINVVCGFICAILGLLLYLNVGNSIGKITGLIGLGSGVIAFVLTLVYIIESGIIFTQDVVNKDYTTFGSEYSNGANIRIDSDGAFLEWDDSKKSYVCIFYKKDKKDSLYLKYSDYGNKYLNYNSDIEFATEKKNYKYIDDSNINTCQFGSNPNSVFIAGATSFYEACKMLDNKDAKYAYGANNDEKKPYYSSSSSSQKEGDCDKIFYANSGQDYGNKNKYDKYVTSLVLGCFIILLDIGLAVFGFLLFKEGNGTSGSVAIK